MSAASESDRRARDLARVTKARQMGRTKYILLRGVLGWGLPMFVIMTVLPAFAEVPWFRETARAPQLFIPLGAVLWLTGGAVFGWMLWRAVEKRHRELTDRRGD